MGSGPEALPDAMPVTAEPDTNGPPAGASVLPSEPVGHSASAAKLPWVEIGWFAVLLIAAFGPALWGLVNQWYNDEDMGHGFFVPVVAGYIAWLNRDRLLSMPWRGNRLGLVIMVWSAFQLLVGTLGAELFLQRTSFIFSLFGAILFLGGWGVVAELSFPLILLCFMIPLPAVIYNQITFPLQLFASAVAEQVLGLIGIPVLREGNVLELASQKLSVVEACSGIRSLLSLTFLSLVYGFFFDQKSWMRWVLLAATIPIAIIANASRVTFTGILSEIDKEFASGFFHLLEGWVIFIVALGLLVAFHRIVNKLAGGRAHA
jgi:exosortase